MVRQPAEGNEEDEREEPPIAELAHADLQARPELHQRTLASIHRRLTAQHLVSLHWQGLGAVLIEFARLALPASNPPLPPRE